MLNNIKEYFKKLSFYESHMSEKYFIIFLFKIEDNIDTSRVQAEVNYLFNIVLISKTFRKKYISLYFYDNKLNLPTPNKVLFYFFG